MGAFDWLFGKQEESGQGQAAFDHPKIYEDVSTGPGVASMSRAAAYWQEEVSTMFADADAALARVLKDASVMMQGAAGDEARGAATPLTQATQEAIEIAKQTGSAVQQQAQGSADFKHAFPAPHKVPPSDIGFGDYFNPVSFAAKSGVRSAHEEYHDQVEAKAREQYESYTQATNDRVGGMRQFSPPPKFTADVAPADTTPVRKVNPDTGYTGDTGRSFSGDLSSSQTPTPPTSGDTAPTPSQPGSVPTSPEVPAGSDSAWTTPPPAPGGTPQPPPPVGTPGGSGPGVVGGAVVPPGGRGPTATPGSGPRGGSVPSTGRGSTGGGRIGTGAGGAGAGSGARGGSSPVSGGGRAGVGSSATPGSSGSGTGSSARPGGTGGVAGGGGGAGKGQRDDKDGERTNEYLEPTAEAWEDLDLPKVAPPVFGDWGGGSDKPPRPPENDG